MHGIHQTNALFDPAFSDQFLNRNGDVDESPAIRDFKPKMLGERFHVPYMPLRTRSAN
jgi:hypothetical protein